MRMVLIPKKLGQFRKIYIPTASEKATLRAWATELEGIARELDVYHVSHGFTENRSAVTNAKQHIGYEYSVCFDIADCFDHVTAEAVLPVLAKHWEKFMRQNAQMFASKLCSIELDCFVDGAARQGLPSSPSLANIALSPIDADIMKMHGKGRLSAKPFVFTRYCDDLSFSTNNPKTVEYLLLEIPKIVERNGFKLNPAKTQVQCAKAGRRIITGIAVGDKAIYPTREVKRRLRAAVHQEATQITQRGAKRLLRNARAAKRRFPIRYRLHKQIEGLQEWIKLKQPTHSYVPAENNRASAETTANIIRGLKASKTIANEAHPERNNPYVRRLV